MCVICIKKRGVKFPTIECVETMCDNNSDGFSMVVSDGRKPIIYKTLNKGKFINQYKRVINMYDEAKTSMYIHARIKTHGTMRIENCHGWKSDGLVFAHNGVLSVANRDDLTDSETFFRDIFSPAYRIGGWRMGDRAIKAIIGTSKFVFMDNKGDIKHYGNYIEDDGLLFSNTSYQRPKIIYPQNWNGRYRWNRDTELQKESVLLDDFGYPYPF